MKGVQPQKMRSLNEQMIIHHLLQHPSATKAELAEATGISVTTIRTQLLRLMDQKKVTTEGEAVSSGGRPAECYTLATNFSPYLYIFFTFHTCNLFVCSLTGNLLAAKAIPTDQLTKEVAALLHHYPAIQQLEVSVPGVPSANGFFYGLNLDEKQYYRLEFMEQLPETIAVTLINDVNLSAYGQLLQYPQAQHLVYLYFADCVGMGIIINREIYSGFQQFSGEVGMLSYGNHNIDYALAHADTEQRKAIIQHLLSLVAVTLSPEIIVVTEPQLSQTDVETIFNQVTASLWTTPTMAAVPQIEESSLLGIQQLAIQHYIKRGLAE